MNWQQAKESTIRQWREIQGSVGIADPVALLTEINAVTDLCGLAREEADVTHDQVKCHFCPAYEQFGGCREVSAALSELVMQRDWAELRRQIGGFLERLEKMEAPGPLTPVH